MHFTRLGPTFPIHFRNISTVCRRELSGNSVNYWITMRANTIRTPWDSFSFRPFSHGWLSRIVWHFKWLTLFRFVSIVSFLFLLLTNSVGGFCNNNGAQQQINLWPNECMRCQWISVWMPLWMPVEWWVSVKTRQLKSMSVCVCVGRNDNRRICCYIMNGLVWRQQVTALSPLSFLLPDAPAQHLSLESAVKAERETTKLFNRRNN